MKKILSISFALLIALLALTGCGDEEKGGASSNTASKETDSSIISSVSVSSDTQSDNISSETTSDPGSSKVETKPVSSQTSSKQTSSEKTSNPVSSQTNPKEDVTECKHNNTKAVSVNTGKNIIDSTKLDVVNHSIVCKDCNKDLGTKAHTIDNGKCTVCGQNNLAQKTVYAITSSYIWDGEGEVKDNGAVSYEVMLQKSWYSAAKGEYAIDEWNYKIPEAAMLDAIRSKFVITDAQFEELKALKNYQFSFGGHTYSNGFFEISAPAAGGPPSHQHKVVGYSDNGQGKLIVYMDYIKCDYESDTPYSEHDYYYAVEYNYSGYSDLYLKESEIGGYGAVVDSLRATSIKKIASLPANMTKPQN